MPWNFDEAYPFDLDRQLLACPGRRVDATLTANTDLIMGENGSCDVGFWLRERKPSRKQPRVIVKINDRLRTHFHATWDPIFLH